MCLTLYLTIILTTQLLKLVWKEQIYSTWTPSVFNMNKLYLCEWYTYLSMALISRNRELKDKNSFSQSSFWEKPWPKQKGTNCSVGLKRLLLETIGADGWWPLSAWNIVSTVLISPASAGFYPNRTGKQIILDGIGDKQIILVALGTSKWKRQLFEKKKKP